jgi:hypothetical protein
MEYSTTGLPQNSNVGGTSSVESGDVTGSWQKDGANGNKDSLQTKDADGFGKEVLDTVGIKR